MMGFILADDCYVYVSSSNNGIFENEEQFQDGSQEHPYDSVHDCVNVLANSSEHTIHLGTGYYPIQNLELGARKLIGSGVNVTVLVPSGNNQNGIYLSGGEISHLAFERNNGYTQFGTTYNFSDAITINGQIYEDGSQQYSKIHNCLFSEGIGGAIIRIDYPYVQIRNNVFDSDQYIHFANQNHIDMKNNMFLYTNSISSLCEDNTNCENVEVMHNLFLRECQLDNQQNANTSYNYFLNSGNNSFQVNGYTFGASNDYRCGEMGQYQDNYGPSTFSQFHFTNDNAFSYNIYSLGEDSYLFDKGHPNPEYNDPDGSRADIGIMGGLYPWTHVGPIMIEFSVDPDPTFVPLDGQININARAVTE